MPTRCCESWGAGERRSGGASCKTRRNAAGLVGVFSRLVGLFSQGEVEAQAAVAAFWAMRSALGTFTSQASPTFSIALMMR